MAHCPDPGRTPPAAGGAHASSPPAASRPLAGLASDADREQVIGVLKAAFAQGRLTHDEFDARVGHALTSRTRADLAALTADLPRPASAGPAATPAKPGSSREEGAAVSRPGSALRTAAQVAAIVGALVVVLGGLLALEAWNEQRTDGVPTASGAAGIAVSADTRLGVSAEGSGADSGTRDFIWQLGARPELLGHFPGGAPLVFAPDSWTVLAASPAGVTEWSLANPARPVRRATMPGPGMAQGIAYAPDRTTVAVAYARAVVLWDLANPAAPNRIATIPVTADVAGPDVAPHFQSQIAFSPDGRMLATTTARRTVTLWDVSTPSAPRYLMTVGSDTGPVAALAFSPAGSQLAYLSETGAVTVADLTDPARPVRAAPLPVASASPFSPAPSALRYSSDGTRLIAAALGGDQYRDRAVCTWNVTDLSRPLAARCRTDHVQVEGAIAFTPDGTAIVEPDPRGANKPSNTLSIWPVHA